MHGRGIHGAMRRAMERPFDIQDRSFLFATEIVDFCKPALPPGAIVRELARQLLNSGTSIGANLEEADAGQSKPDFRSKIAISRKEARETRYWLRLIAHADPRVRDAAAPLIDEARQLINILTTIKVNSERNDDRGTRPGAGR
jgi:four helix bundle protein